MPPQLIGYDPTAGISALKEAAGKISQTLVMARQAEDQLQQTKKQNEAMQFLSGVISERASTVNPMIARMPLLDPVVSEAAMAVQGIIPDYVDSIAKLQKANESMFSATSVVGGYLQLDPDPSSPTFGQQKYIKTAEPKPQDTGAKYGIPGGTTTNEILLQAHLGDPDVYVIDPETGEKKVDPVAIAKKVSKDLFAIGPATRAAAAAEGSGSVTGPREKKEKLDELATGFNTSVSTLLQSGFTAADIGVIINGQHMQGGRIRPEPEYDRFKATGALQKIQGVPAEQVEKVMEAFSKLTDEQKAEIKAKYPADMAPVQEEAGGVNQPPKAKGSWDDALD